MDHHAHRRNQGGEAMQHDPFAFQRLSEQPCEKTQQEEYHGGAAPVETPAVIYGGKNRVIQPQQDCRCADGDMDLTQELIDFQPSVVFILMGHTVGSEKPQDNAEEAEGKEKC